MTKIKDKRLIYNALQCLLCEDIIESKHRHDYKHCRCGNAMVDGGREYQRCGTEKGWETIKDLSKYEEYERQPYIWEK